MVSVGSAQEPVYLKRNQVDEQKWNRCIDSASNNIIYAYSSYLDHMSPGWHALVYGDYEMVMPLTWKKKWGISYLHQPAFTQQLGIFHSGAVTEDQLRLMLEYCQRRFRFAEIALNHLNKLPGTSPRQNFVLDLAASHEHLRAGYKKDLLNNLKVAERSALRYGEGDFTSAIRQYRQEYDERLPHIRDQHYQAFERFCMSGDSQAQPVVRKVCDSKGVTLSAAILLKTRNRLILSVSVVSENGKSYSANHFLLDRLIQEFSGTPYLLDFEGSDVPGIASFYRTFGSIDQPYYFYRYNLLPYPIRLLKS